jgi:hypothetical protein
VEGGNAGTFGGDNQNMMIQSHNHRYTRNFYSLTTSESDPFERSNSLGSRAIGRATLNRTEGDFYYDTNTTGGTETRPVNTTIKVWKRTS